MTQIAQQGVGLVQAGPKDSRLDHLTRRLARPVQALRAVPHLGTWLGVACASVGVALLAVAWGKTAGLTNVALQIPYVVSAGFTGLGLVAVGLTVVNLSAKQADARVRTRQVSELRELLTELRRTIEEEGQ
jgi:hypothetical protein